MIITIKKKILPENLKKKQTFEQLYAYRLLETYIGWWEKRTNTVSKFLTFINDSFGKKFFNLNVFNVKIYKFLLKNISYTFERDIQTYMKTLTLDIFFQETYEGEDSKSLEEKLLESQREYTNNYYLRTGCRKDSNLFQLPKEEKKKIQVTTLDMIEITVSDRKENQNALNINLDSFFKKRV